MTSRPPIGTRVRLKLNRDYRRLGGKTGVISKHHVDGIAFFVALDDNGASFICDPVDVEPEPANG